VSVLLHSLFKERERELCVRERLAENKLARAEGLLKNYSLLKEQRFLSLAGGPGMRASSEQELLPALAFQSPELLGGCGSVEVRTLLSPWLTLWDQRREALRGDEFVFSFVHFVKLHVQ